MKLQKLTEIYIITAFLTVVMVMMFLSKAYAEEQNTFKNVHEQFRQTEELFEKLSGIKGPETSRQILLGGASYYPDELIHDFSQIAISKTAWLDEGKKGTLTPVYRGSYEQVKRRHPILAEYLFRKNGYPELQAINKWDREITIGIGWQKMKAYDSINNKMRTLSAEGMDPWGQQNIDAYPLFRNQIEKLIPSIEELTGLSVTLIDPDDPRETTDLKNSDLSKPAHARIRIVPTKLTHSRATFPHRGGTIEKYFLAGVPFTPYEYGQVDGYLLPNADNSIGFAACRINPEIGESLVRAYITECLVRSLGLPNLSLNDDTAMPAISGWGREIDSYVKNWRGANGKNFLATGPIRDLAKQEDLIEKVTSNNLPRELTLYDAFMIALLYCPQIQRGMNIYELEILLQKDPSCLNQAKEKLNGRYSTTLP